MKAAILVLLFLLWCCILGGILAYVTYKGEK